MELIISVSVVIALVILWFTFRRWDALNFEEYYFVDLFKGISPDNTDLFNYKLDMLYTAAVSNDIYLYFTDDSKIIINSQDSKSSVFSRRRPKCIGILEVQYNEPVDFVYHTEPLNKINKHINKRFIFYRIKIKR